MLRRMVVPTLICLAATAVLAQSALKPGFERTLRTSPGTVQSAIVMLAGDDPFTGAEPVHSRASRQRVKEVLMERSRRSAEPVMAELARWSEEARAMRADGRKVMRDVQKVDRLWTINALLVRATGQALLDLAGRVDVSRVIPDSERHLPAPRPSRGRAAQGPFTYGLLKLGIDRVQKDLGQYGEGVVVGHLDTGIDANHADLKGKVLQFKNFVATSGATDQPVDDHGHGTHTAGTIAGGNASKTAIGVAPKAKLIVGKIFTGSGSSTDSQILAAMNWVADPDGNPATDDTPALCSNSWGGSAGTEEAEKPYWDMVKTWIRVGMFPCFAAGNEGPGASTVGTPGGYPHSFAVGATDDKDQAAYFSSRGPITWSGVTYVKPEVSAPGVDVYSAKPGGGYQTMDGTSMACPHAAGLITLLYGVHADYTIEQMTDLLKKTSVDLGTAGPDNTFGTGRLDGFSAVQVAIRGGRLSLKLADESGRPLAGRVSIGGRSTVELDATGAATVMLVAGSYTLKASSFGYLDETAQVDVAAGQTVSRSFTLKKAAESKLVVTVTDETTHAAIPATVRIVGTPIAEAATDAAGQARVGLPRGTYTVAVRAFAHAPKTVEGVVVDRDQVDLAVTLAHLPDILLYDHDQGKGYETFFQAALGAMGKTFTYHDASASGEAAQDTILGYPVVIWFTGDDYSHAVPEAMQAILKTYLQTGGRLLITGQDIGYGLKSSPFLKEVLHAKFVKDAVTTRQVSGAGLSFKIEGGDGANNQKYPDGISIEGAAGVETVFEYAGEGPAGLLASSGSGKVCYLPFGFEGIDTSANRRKALELLLGKLVPSLEQRAARLAPLGKVLGAGAARLYEEWLIEAYEHAPADQQRRAQGMIRGLKPRTDR